MIDFHNAITDPPKKDGKYLVIYKFFISSDSTYSIAHWANNLYKVDKWDFNRKRGKAGWYDYDSEYGYFERDHIVAWAELPEIPEEYR